MHTNKQEVFTVAAFSFPHCSNDLHQYHVSLLFHTPEVMFQDLAPHQCRDCHGFSSGTLSLLKPGKKMEILEGSSNETSGMDP